MRPLLVGACGLLVSPLVIADHLAHMTRLRRPPPTTKQDRAPHVQLPSHLLPRHPWIFPPGAGPGGPTRTPSRSGSGSGAASAPCIACPRSASAPPLVSPLGSSARPSRAGTPPPAPASAARPPRWSRSTSPPPSPD